MKEDIEINNFEDFTSFIEEEKVPHESIFQLLQEMTNTSKEYLLQSPSKEAFVRIVYNLDQKAQIPAEAIRFIAIKFFPFFESDKIDSFLKKFAFFWQKQELRENFIGDWLEELCDENKDANLSFSKEIDVEIEHLQDTWEEEIFQEERRQGFFGIIKEHFARFNLFLQGVYEGIEHKSFKEMIKSLPKAEDSLLPLFKKKMHPLSQAGKRSYQWLEKRRFFFPILQSSVKKIGHYGQRAYHWVLYEQEIYVRQKPYHKGKQGYGEILQRAKSKIYFSSIHKKHLQKLYTCQIQDFFRVLRGILVLENASREERDPFTLLKDCIAIQEKSLEQAETVLDVINYGMTKFQRMLQWMSRLTNKRKLNHRIQSYLLQLVEKSLLNYPEIFRKQIEQTVSYNDLKKVMSYYPLYRTSIVLHYESLDIILTVKNILEEFEETPEELERILLKYFGETGEVNLRNKLPEILVNNSINEKIWEKIAHENYLDEMLPKLSRLRQIPECRKAANSLYKLITVFLRGEGDFTFNHFKISLNFVPPKIQTKILYLVQQQLQEELNASVNTILAKRGKHVKRLYQLRKHFVDTRYRDSRITLFGYNPYEIEKRISAIEYEEGKMHKILYHSFSNGKVPETFLRLVAKAKKAEKAAQEKNIPNTMRMLHKIQKAISHREDVDLYKVLIALFKINGSLDFSKGESHPVVNGYQIAEEINRFYQTPNRIEISLSEGILPEIKTTVEALINQEREKQLSKIVQ